MIYTTASLTLLLASAGVKTAVARNALAALKNSNVQEFHAKNIAALTEKVRAAPHVAGDESNRELFDNTNFLNYFYSSDDACANAPYTNAGLGMGSCIAHPQGGSYTLACSGPQSEILVTMMSYVADDCSGTAIDESMPVAFTSSNTYDGTCAIVTEDDDTSLDDRFGILPFSGSFSVTCDATRSATNTAVDIEAFNEDTCDLMTSYTGINLEACFYHGQVDVEGPVDAWQLFSKAACDSVFYSDNTCSTLIDYNDDDMVDEYDDTDDITGGTCTTAEGHQDDYFFPGQYYSSTEGSCDDDDDKITCFAGSETVLLESGATKAISDVGVGDVIQVVSADGSLTFSEVVFLPHGANTQKALFTELELASGNSLRATPAHFVLAGACGADAFELTAMQDVAKGSCVQTAGGEDEVTGIGHVIDHGIYTVVTKESSGLIVVNGVRASSFANNHWLVNNYYNIHRAVYEVAPSLMKNRNVVAANLIIGDIAMSL
jgi:hypothetical protein